MDPGLSLSSSKTCSSVSDYGYSSSFSYSSSDQQPSRSSFSFPPVDQSNLISLISEISATDSESLEQLERENVHFVICESLIQALEEMRWSAQQSANEPNHSFRSTLGHKRHASSVSLTESIPRTSSPVPDDVARQWVRFRSRIVSSDEDFSLSSSPSLLSAMDSESDFMNCSISSVQSFAEPLDYVENTALLPVLKNWGISLSNTSLFSLDEEQETARNTTTDESSKMDTSAESIAYNLLRKFSLVNDVEIEKARTDWIIAEESDEVPQKLLPIPKSTPISPDQVEEETVKSLSMVKLRGNFDWAPPRKQIIFTIYSPKSGSKKAQMALQNFRCAGCGQRIEAVYFPRMLFCYYTGKYYCQFGCHRNNKSLIPALVINKWDFRQYPVSTFAFNLIRSIEAEKLFDLQSLGLLQALLKKSRTFSKLVYLRSQLVSLRQYISLCKKGGNILLCYLIFEPKDLVNFATRDLYLFSLNDLIQIKTDGKLVDRMLQLVKASIKHISSCSSCRAKGFYCEICSSSPESKSVKDLIFPFEFGRVTSCQSCGSCVHTKCLKQRPDHKCLRCERRAVRDASPPCDDQNA